MNENETPPANTAMAGCLVLYTVDGAARRTSITGEALARSGGDATAWLPAGATDVTVYTGVDADRERERFATEAQAMESVSAIDDQLKQLDLASLRPLRAILAGAATVDDHQTLRAIEGMTQDARDARRDLVDELPIAE